jgi:hypothetical protein
MFSGIIEDYKDAVDVDSSIEYGIKGVGDGIGSVTSLEEDEAAKNNLWTNELYQ